MTQQQPLDLTDAQNAWDVLATTEAEVKAEKPRRYYKPLSDAAAAFVSEAQDSNRIYTGQPEFDEEMRGIGRGHLCMVQGYSHSGKTQWLLQLLRHNKKKRIMLMIPDEPAPLVLSKLASVETNIPARELEQRISVNDRDSIELLKSIATDEFPNLAVFDQPLSAESMNGAYDEMCEVWDADPELVIVDYVDLVQVGDMTGSKFEFLKAFCSKRKVPMIALHQTSRSAGRDGQKMKIDSGNFGGETFATFVIGVRRLKAGLEAEREELLPKVHKGSEAAADRLAEVEYDLRIHQYTMTVNLVKNKRPGGQLVDDIDMEIDQQSGRLYALNGDLPSQFRADARNNREIRAHATVPVETWDQQEAF